MQTFSFHLSFYWRVFIWQKLLGQLIWADEARGLNTGNPGTELSHQYSRTLTAEPALHRSLYSKETTDMEIWWNKGMIMLSEMAGRELVHVWRCIQGNPFYFLTFLGPVSFRATGVSTFACCSAEYRRQSRHLVMLQGPRYIVYVLIVILFFSRSSANGYKDLEYGVLIICVIQTRPVLLLVRWEESVYTLRQF